MGGRSQKIGDNIAIVYTVYTFGVLFENHVILLLLFIRVYFQETSQVAASVTVVRGRPDSHNVFVLKEKLVSLLNELMGSGYQAESVVMIEFIDYFRSKKPSYSSMILSPTLDIFRV